MTFQGDSPNWRNLTHYFFPFPSLFFPFSALNNAEVASGYISELASEEIMRRLGRKLTNAEHENLQSCVRELGSLANRFKQLVESGLNELNNSALKPEVKPVINEFQDIPHDIDDVEFAEAEANEPWIQAVLISLHNLLETFKPRMSPGECYKNIYHKLQDIF